MWGERADIKPFKSGGTGVLSFLENQPMELPTRLEAGTLNGPGIAGLLTGVMELEKIGLDNIYAKEHELMQAFIEKNKDNPRNQDIWRFRYAARQWYALCDCFSKYS